MISTNFNYRLPWNLVFLVLSLRIAVADAVNVGDPLKPGDLPHAISDAYAHGARDITINPGTYELPAIRGQDSIYMESWSDTTIHAGGVVIVFDQRGYGPFTMERCKNVTWDGGIIGFSRTAATQGRVTALGSDPDGSSYCDWQIDAGYPTDIDPVKSCYDIVDSSSRVLRVGTGDWTPASFEKLAAPGSFRLHYRNKPGFLINDWLVTRAPNGNMTTHLDNCENCTLSNMTLFNGGFASIFDTGGIGGNHYLKCRIRTGPRPVGATEDQIVSAGADGLHSAGTQKGPDIEDCIFTGVFLDDCIAIHGGFGRVISAEGNTLILKGGDPVVGQPLRISDTHGFFGQATVTEIEKAPDGGNKITLDQDLHVPIDHSQDKEEKLGTKANNPDRCGEGYRILRCRLGDTRSRGILVKADNGIIAGCTIDGCGMSGVSIGPEFWWGEANYSWNVTVSHNTFHNCSKNNGDQASVWVHWDGAMGNHNIICSNNLFDTCYGQYLIRIDGTDGLQVVGNKFIGSFTVKAGQPGNVLHLDHSKNVFLMGNVWPIQELSLETSSNWIRA